MRRLFKSVFGLLVFAAVGGLAFWVFVEVRAEQAAKPEGEKKGEKAEKVSRVSHAPNGEVTITLDAETVERAALEVKALAGATRQPQVTAYGVFEADPSRVFTLRAPLAGVLARAEGNEWPRLGQNLKPNSIAGVIQPRLTPVERTDLTTRLASIKGDIGDITAQLPVAKSSYESKKVLYTERRAVSDLTFKEAEAKLKGLEARLKATTEIAQLIEASLKANASPIGALPLTVEQEGEVSEVLARPGETIEAGQPILQVSRFDRLIARVELPACECIESPLPVARIVPLGYEERSPLRGERIGVAPTVSAMTRGQAFLFAVATGETSLRPGVAATAFLDLPGAPQKGVTIPRSAVVRFAIKAWVYVQSDKDKFARREVPLDHSTQDGWFVTAGFAPGDRVIVQGAQSLLSEELKSQTGEEE